MIRSLQLNEQRTHERETQQRAHHAISDRQGLRMSTYSNARLGAYADFCTDAGRQIGEGQQCLLGLSSLHSSDLLKYV